MTRIVVIGAGFGGLAAAVRLLAAGYQVTVVEALERPGGRAGYLELGPYRFDTGPTLITLPSLLDELCRLAETSLENELELVRLRPAYRIMFSDGTWFDYWGEPELDEAEIARYDRAAVPAFRSYMTATRRIYERAFGDLAREPFDSLTSFLRVVPELLALRAHESVYRFAGRFFREPHLRMVFSFHPLFIGGNPFYASSIYSMVHYLEREWGVYYAVGGTCAIVDALVRLLRELGVAIHLNAEVRELIVEGRRIRGVALADGSEHRADIVVSNADVAHTYADLIAPRYRRRYTDRRLRSLKYSMSLVVIYLGTRRTYHDAPLVRHNIIFGPRYRELLDDIFIHKRVAEDFSLYLHMPSRDEPDVAPPGCDAFYVLSPVPNLASQADWASLARPYRDAIIAFLEERFLPDLSKNIVVERIADPRYFQRRQNNYFGAAFAFEPTLLQSAWFRPHNRSEEFDNLYFVGAGTHPGAGLPGVLSSALIVERLVQQERVGR